MDQKIDALHSSHQILDIAQHLVQTRGFNAFSYADIAKVMHVSKTSLHYHFATKADLGTKLVERYHTAFERALDEIDATDCSMPEKLRRFTELYARVLANERMCLCGMLAAEFVTLPPAMQEALNRFFELNETWLAVVLENGRKQGSLRFTGTAKDTAIYIISTLEGSMMLARAHGGMARFDVTTRHLLTDLAIN
jgi:TetR/AcrR family transcriptional regulator, transcriptional repressor for nem operon